MYPNKQKASYEKPEMEVLLPERGSSVLRPVEPWEIPMRGRPCKITYKDETTSMGRFIAFATDFMELQDGIGQYPVAIVELEDGTVQVVYVEQVQFMDRR